MQLPESFTTVTKLSKILALILFISLPFVGFSFGYRFGLSSVICPSINNPNQVSPKPTLSNAWLTYNNPEIGIRFQYPQSFGNPNVKNSGTSSTGKFVSISFSLNSEFYFSAFTDNYHHLLELPQKRTIIKCPKDLFITGTANNFSSQCRNLSLENGSHVMTTNFDIPECSPFFSSTIYLYNLKSEYKNIEIRWSSANLNKQINFSCTNENQANQANQRAAQFSQNIMTETNLDPADQRSLSDLKKIAGSVQFIK